MKQKRCLTLLLGCLLLSLAGACTSASELPELTPKPWASPTATLSQDLLATDIARQATPTPEPSQTPWRYATLTPSSKSANTLGGVYSPLTGLNQNRPDGKGQRPILVKMANWPEALRPQAGLNAADIVFEYYIGAQMSHFAALYYGTAPEAAAPLAPARAPDTRLAIHYGADLTYQSARPNILKLISDSLPGRNFMANTLPCPAICAEPNTKGGNIAVNLPALRNYISSLERKEAAHALEGLSFSRSPGKENGHALRLSYLYADYSVMDWRYAKETGKYQLWQDLLYAPGKYRLSQSFDRDSGMPIAFDNILILYTHYISYGQDGYDIDMRESDPEQQALLLRDGKIYYGKWLVSAPDQPIQFKGPNGLDIPLKPGRSWISFASINTISKQVQPGVWELSFSFN
ncbi:MAG: DUF3048 C-terminal domain-containing protein [Anaerolineaceae bacterium]|nr:DUF3048 C-terminal domain-containing protein [Anaerolineaceae bacterium]